jgi:hypothetical protein
MCAKTHRPPGISIVLSRLLVAFNDRRISRLGRGGWLLLDSPQEMTDSNLNRARQYDSPLATDHRSLITDHSPLVTCHPPLIAEY